MNGHETLSLAAAAAHVHVDANELRHCAQRGEIEAVRRGDEWFFPHRALDEWAQRDLLEAPHRERLARQREMAATRRAARLEELRVADLFRPAAIDLGLAAKAKGGLIRDMTDLAGRSGLVYDAEALFKELVAREEAASTAIGAGAAFLHPRFHDPYFFEETFLAYGRSDRAIFFGAPDGAGTRHFFLICATDHAVHLHILARLAVLAHGTDLLDCLATAETPEAALDFIRLKESEFFS